MFEVTACSSCIEKHCIDCMPHYDCQYPNCYTSTCEDCAREDGMCAAEDCSNNGERYCGEHLMVKHIRLGADAFCLNCNARAASALKWRNRSFEEWVVELESRYGVEDKCLRCESESFSDLLEQRQRLRQRCAALGDKLPFKQKQFEEFDERVREYESGPLGVSFSD